MLVMKTKIQSRKEEIKQEIKKFMLNILKIQIEKLKLRKRLKEGTLKSRSSGLEHTVSSIEDMTLNCIRW